MNKRTLLFTAFAAATAGLVYLATETYQGAPTMLPLKPGVCLLN